MSNRQTVEYLNNRVKINVARLDTEVVDQPLLFGDVCEYANDAWYKWSLAKQKVEEVEAQTWLLIKKVGDQETAKAYQITDKDEQKRALKAADTTVPEKTAMVACDEAVKQAKREAIDAEYAYKQASKLLKQYEQRGDALDKRSKFVLAKFTAWGQND